MNLLVEKHRTIDFFNLYMYLLVIVCHQHYYYVFVLLIWLYSCTDCFLEHLCVIIYSDRFFIFSCSYVDNVVM